MELLKLMFLIASDLRKCFSQLLFKNSKVIRISYLTLQRDDCSGKEQALIIENILLKKDIDLLFVDKYVQISRGNVLMSKTLNFSDIIISLVSAMNYNRHLNEEDIQVLNATNLRVCKKGKIPKTFNNKVLRIRLAYCIIRNTRGLKKYMIHNDIHGVFVSDPGYIGEYELAKTARLFNKKLFKLNNSFQSSTYLLNYDQEILDHPFNLKDYEIEKVKSLNANIEVMKNHLELMYKNRAWYDYVGTLDFIDSNNSEIHRLNELKNEFEYTATIFPHIMWDGTFFNGKNLFETYEDWFRFLLESIEEVSEKLWIIKLHPANIFKNNSKKNAEEKLIWEVFKKKQVPRNIEIIESDSPISALDLIKLSDEIHSVRGTVLLEAAIYGVTPIAYGESRFNIEKICLSVDSIDEAKKIVCGKNVFLPNQEFAVKLFDFYSNHKTLNLAELEERINDKV